MWNNGTEIREQVPLTDEQKAELDRRLDAYHRNPDQGSPWEIVRERILNRASPAF